MSARDRGASERAGEGASSDVITTCRLWSGAVAEAHGARDGRRCNLRAFAFWSLAAACSLWGADAAPDDLNCRFI